MNNEGVEVGIRHFLFLCLGIERTHCPVVLRDVAYRARWDTLSEPSGSKICRRNILALGCMLVLAGDGDIDPHDLNVFGLEFSGARGVFVLGTAAILAQIYWYFMRYQQLKEDGTLLVVSGAVSGLRSDAKLSDAQPIDRIPADLWANRAAVLLTILSWVFIAIWVFGPDTLPS